MLFETDDLRIRSIKELLPPVALLERFPLSENASETVFTTRTAIHRILNGEDDRLLVIVGPCSIHDPTAALEYGKRLVELREKYKDSLEIVMRVYFEKPRTRIGWKGMINDPYMDNSFKLNDGLRLARDLLLNLNDMGVPTAGEFLDMITPQYIADLMCWGAIGARTTESQVHRELASGLSCRVGFKNGTNGNIDIAMDAIGASSASHHFLSVTKFGHSAIVETSGNPDCHIILRGGKKPNYFREDIADISQQLEQAGQSKRIMVDFSHANSLKQFKKQIDVCDSICEQLVDKDCPVFGVMIESHLKEGNQKLTDPAQLEYGKSITDGCIGWEDTELVLEKLSKAKSR